MTSPRAFRLLIRTCPDWTMNMSWPMSPSRTMSSPSATTSSASPVARRPACLARSPGDFIRCGSIGSHRTGGHRAGARRPCRLTGRRDRPGLLRHVDVGSDGVAGALLLTWINETGADLPLPHGGRTFECGLGTVNSLDPTKYSYALSSGFRSSGAPGSAFCCAPPPGRPPAAERGPDRPGDQRRAKAASDARRESPRYLAAGSTSVNGKVQTSDGTFYGIDAIGEIAAIHPSSTGWGRPDMPAQT